MQANFVLMARLLRNEDYTKYIKERNLLQVLEDSWVIAQDVEQAAQQEMIGMISQRYLTDEIFTNTTQYDSTLVYYGKNLVYYTETAFSATTVYTLGQRVSREGNIYSSISGSAAHAWNASEWGFVCVDNKLYYVKLPQDEFDFEAEYVTGNIVWYKNKTYTAKTAITGIVPTNTGFWTAGATYSITGTYPTDDTVWTKGDNRNPLVVMRLIDITLFHLHKRIPAMNFPDIRKEAYDGNSPSQQGGAIGWLKRIQKGEENLSAPAKLPYQNLSMNWGNGDGSTVFVSNTY